MAHVFHNTDDLDDLDDAPVTSPEREAHRETMDVTATGVKPNVSVEASGDRYRS